MEEHVAVFDCPQLYGKGIPTYYRIQLIDVPHNKVDEIVKLLSDLGFISVLIGEDDLWNEFEVDEIDYNNVLIS